MPPTTLPSSRSVSVQNFVVPTTTQIKKEIIVPMNNLPMGPLPPLAQLPSNPLPSVVNTTNASYSIASPTIAQTQQFIPPANLSPPRSAPVPPNFARSPTQNVPYKQPQQYLAQPAFNHRPANYNTNTQIPNPMRSARKQVRPGNFEANLPVPSLTTYQPQAQQSYFPLSSL